MRVTLLLRRLQIFLVVCTEPKIWTHATFLQVTTVEKRRYEANVSRGFGGHSGLKNANIFMKIKMYNLWHMQIPEN